MKRFLTAAVFSAAAFSWAAQAPVRKPAPKLILAIVVDQFRYDYLTRFRSDYSGGLTQLLTKGAVYSNAHYEHFPTVTAIGHATLLSGALPTVSGIIGNEWFDRATGKQVTSVSDASVQTLGSPDRTGASPRRMLADTLGDQMKMSGRWPVVKVIGISSKDRSAILPVGHAADGAYWYDTTTGNFVSSTYYFPELPAWVTKFNAERLCDQWLGKPLTPAQGGAPFSTLPAKPDKAYYDALDASAFHNDLLVMFAERAIEAEKLGANGGVDLLSISFSANDRIGHKFGPDSPQVRDVSIRTDKTLARLFAYLDKRIGMANVSVVFTADHGVAPVPEVQQQRRMAGARLPDTEVLAAAEKALTARYGEAKWILGKTGPAPYIDHRIVDARKLDLAAVQETAAAGVRALPGIARVYTREELQRGNASPDDVGRRILSGLYYQRAPDLFVVPQPYTIFDKTGTTHGTPYNYDAHVPIIFMGPAFKPGRYTRRIAVNDIASTLAAHLDLEPPAGAMGRVLDEMLIW